MIQTIELESLVGEHILNTAPVWSDFRPEYGEDGAIMCIGIDGKTYTFTEDPSDGYRSYMNMIEVEEGLNHEKLMGAAPINRKVTIIYDDGSGKRYPYNRDKDDLIHITDVATGHHWATLGTRAVDDYYPSCTMEWYPLDLSSVMDFTPQFKAITEKSAASLAEAFGYDEVMIYARRGNDEHVASYRKDREK